MGISISYEQLRIIELEEEVKRLKRDVSTMPTCGTCEYWKLGHEFNHGDADLTYCTEMRFWVNMMGVKYPHTTADFGCNKHSDYEA